MAALTGASKQQLKELGRLDVKEVWPHQSCDVAEGSQDETKGSCDPGCKLKYTELEHTQLLQQVCGQC